MMSGKPNSAPKEEPYKRFRRLLEGAEEVEKEVTKKLSIQIDKPLEIDLEKGSGLDTGIIGASGVTEDSSPDDGGGKYDENDVHIDVSSHQMDGKKAVDKKEEGKITKPPIRFTPSPPPLGTSGHIDYPAIDTQGMPLPRKVGEIDMGVTRVTDTSPREKEKKGEDVKKIPRLRALPQVNIYQIWKKLIERINSIQWGRNFGCVLRMSVIALFGGICLLVGSGSFGIYQYFRIAKTLPSVENLRRQTAQFETTRIYDRNGNILYEILDPNAGRRTYVSLDEISPYLVAATLTTEDKEFYSHPGFDPIAILRGFWQNFRSGEIASGASTITQQLARTLLFSAEERSERSYTRKIREAVLATEITRRYSKDEILELYLNEIYYGNLAYGIEAASQTYFNISADKLTLAQSTFLAGLPQAPSVYDVYSNREVTLERYRDVLVLMYEASQETGCIFVSNNPQRICVSAVDAASSAKLMEDFTFSQPDIKFLHPHWVYFIRSLLEATYDPQTIYRSGFSVYTTLDPGLQNAAQQIVRDHIDELSDRNVTNGALVAINPVNGEILAMVGSADFYNDSIQGQINMAMVPRQPGSAIKPLTYLAAFEKGWTASTLLWDVPSEFPPSGDDNDPRPPYIPTNYDDRFHGPVTVRSALANSYNIPAVKTLQFIGIYDDPKTIELDGLIGMAGRLGITSLTRNDYGLSLTLGGGEVSLYEMTSAYATIANGGRRIKPVAITKIEDHNGKVIFSHENQTGEQILRSEHAYLISSILSDNEARIAAFGPSSVLNLPFQAASKTGTTNDFRDNWTLGYTPDIVVGVWVGNAFPTPMQDVSGLTGAAPIWAELIQVAIQQRTGGYPSPFIKPAGVVERVICTVSGTEPSQWCPSQRSEYFAADQLPLPKGEDLWQKVEVDTWTDLLASSSCSTFIEDKYATNVFDPWAVKWIQDDSSGQDWADEHGFSKPLFFTPKRSCHADDPHPLFSFSSPHGGEIITRNPISVIGLADATDDFYQYRLEYGFGDNPSKWEVLIDSKIPIREPDEIFSWDVSKIPSGIITIRLFMESIKDTFAELRLRLDLQIPTPTPTPSNTPTITPTNTPTPTITHTNTNTSTPSSTPSSTSSPTNTSTPTNTRIPKASLTFTPSPSVTMNPTSTPVPSTTPTLSSTATP